MSEQKKIDLKEIDKQIFYNTLIYQYNKNLDKTVKGLEYKLIDKINKNIYCTRAKTKKLNISKKIQEKIETIESKIEIDVTETGKIISIEGNKYIHFKIDYYSNKVFVSFLKRKSVFPKNRVGFLSKLNKEK